jgi:hypothetical protein
MNFHSISLSIAQIESSAKNDSPEGYFTVRYPSTCSTCGFQGSGSENFLIRLSLDGQGQEYYQSQIPQQAADISEDTCSSRFSNLPALDFNMDNDLKLLTDGECTNSEDPEMQLDWLDEDSMDIDLPKLDAPYEVQEPTDIDYDNDDLMDLVDPDIVMDFGEGEVSIVWF